MDPLTLGAEVACASTGLSPGKKRLKAVECKYKYKVWNAKCKSTLSASECHA